MRTVNRKLFEKWLRQNEKALALLEVKTSIGQTTLRKIKKGHCPGKLLREALASATGISEDVLFPVKEENAS